MALLVYLVGDGRIERAESFLPRMLGLFVDLINGFLVAYYLAPVVLTESQINITVQSGEVQQSSPGADPGAGGVVSGLRTDRRRACTTLRVAEASNSCAGGGRAGERPDPYKENQVAPIEVFFGVIVFLFALIGLVRGFLRELGVTTVIMFLLFFLNQFEPYLDTGLDRVVATGMVSSATGDGGANALRFWIFAFVIMGAAFISYQGETLAFAGPRRTARKARCWAA
jgi:uncharacterized membrane protein required for colicin V production